MGGVKVKLSKVGFETASFSREKQNMAIISHVFGW